MNPCRNVPIELIEYFGYPKENIQSLYEAGRRIPETALSPIKNHRKYLSARSSITGTIRVSGNGNVFLSIPGTRSRVILMGGVYCRKCGEPWDFYYVTHEMSPVERSDFVKGLGCPKCRARTPPHVTEKEKALASIIEILGEIEQMVKRFETVRSTGPVITIPEGANRALEHFFYSCQVAEERIKTAVKKNYITATQVTALNNELHENVRKMLRVTAQSPSLAHAMQALLDTNDPVIKDLITQST